MPLIFTLDDFEGVQPHKDHPVVIVVTMVDYNLKRVLVDQGSSADVMFWTTFVGLGISEDLLQPFASTLLGFIGSQADVRGYVDLRTTFGTGSVPRHLGFDIWL